ncbi:hypothetical protein GQ464_008040 [Rhodocaloribacter litoris]|uniref:hypothetical protein n=1 Tax=Rhodocaloribacter litoris TaxID=2558931 RepID=UPI0014222D3D|nr:hypothetical protein [Rhodocaloribacter litoris]QXD16877.1 hypothetical protein GQ464_008040 [Rhodocaloribacter litoris]
MVRKSMVAGLVAVQRRPGLVALTYGVNLALAFILAVPVYVVLADVVGPTGFGDDLVHRFDIVLWADILEKAGPLLGALWSQLLWMIPLYVVWKVLLSVGLFHALRDGAARPFWTGVGRYGGRGLLVSAIYGVLGLVWAGFSALVTAGIVLGWGGEVGAFWGGFVVGPALAALGLAVLDLMHDYALIAVVTDERRVWAALLAGIRWPLRHAAAPALYALWLLPAALLLLLPTLVEFNLGGVWGVFLLQQLFLVARAAVTVAWYGSEVALYEAVRQQETPLLAGTDAPVPFASGEVASGRSG